MRVAYALTPELREKFKNPFGVLLRGTSTKTMTLLKTIIAEKKPPKIISVGDSVSKNLHKHGIVPQLSITDNRSLRRNIKPIVFEAKRVVKVQNPQGVITDEAVDAVRTALRGTDSVHIKVDGEEDLLTPIAVLYAPEGALVVYGQPYEGVVIVRVTSEKQVQARKLLDLMVCSKAK